MNPVDPEDIVLTPDDPIILPKNGSENSHDSLPGELAEQIPEVILQLKQAIFSGIPWHLALLQAIGHWTKPVEIYQERTYQYMIQGEAFDWLLLAERLCT